MNDPSDSREIGMEERDVRAPLISDEDTRPRCFVMQPFDCVYNKRYKLVYRNAIEKAGFRPYRIDAALAAEDVPDAIREAIECSAICFADISENNPNVWYELGYAWARQVPIVLVCSEKRRSPQGRIQLPLDVQCRSCVEYYSSIFVPPREDDKIAIHDFEKKLSRALTQAYEKRQQAGERSSFWHWVITNGDGFSRSVRPTVDLGEEHSSGYLQIGDAMLLLGSRYTYGYPYIKLNPERPGEDRGFAARLKKAMDESHYDSWREKVKSHETMRGRKLRMKRIVPDLTDDTILQVDTEEITYKEARSFQEVLESKKEELPARYLKEALEMMVKGTRLPNIMVSHVIVVFGEDEDLQLLIAHRSPRKREGAYSAGEWSLSFEEQFSAFADRIDDDTVLPVDKNVTDSVQRGVVEEFLGSEYPRDQIDVSIHGLMMETRSLNFAFLAVVRLRRVRSLDALAGLWRKADDREEHCEIAAVPLRKGDLERCMERSFLPKDFYTKLPKATGTLPDYPDKEDERWREDNKWHPTSAMRAALGLWYLENEARRRPSPP